MVVEEEALSAVTSAQHDVSKRMSSVFSSFEENENSQSRHHHHIHSQDDVQCMFQ